MEPHRDQILAVLRDAPAGLNVEQLAGRVALHPNTIRWHLGRLADAGLVRSRPAHHGRPGRPRIVYEATGEAPEAVESYRFLAEVLASALAGSGEGAAAAEAAGRAWGGYLVERPPPGVRLSPEETSGRIVELLAGHGFEPTRADDLIEMRACPFRELVDAYGDVVCGLHRGLLTGALDALDAGVVLTALEPYPVPGLCRARLEVR
jgi:predicted ArsR family transcriptional regulator